MANMTDILERALSEEEKQEVNELTSLFIILPKEDRAALLSYANAFKVRRDIEIAKGV